MAHMWALEDSKGKQIKIEGRWHRVVSARVHSRAPYTVCLKLARLSGGRRCILVTEKEARSIEMW